MQDISEFLKIQMSKDNCTSLCAFLSLKGEDEYESLQSTKQISDAKLQQFNQLGARDRGCKGLATHTKF